MNPDKHEKLKFLQQNRAFLGREYLTWLWYKVDSCNHVIDLEGYEPFHLYFNDKMVLSSANGAVREHSLKGGTPAYASEAKRALRKGKLVSEANFIMKQGNKKLWTWSMKADDLSFRAMKLPPVEAEEAGDYLLSRIEATQVLVDVHHHLYREFLKLRLSQAFHGEADKMIAWSRANEYKP